MVNTFLVHEDFYVSAQQLDSRRLGKQRTESWQIYRDILGLRTLARYFNLPDYPIEVETPVEQRQAWMQQVTSTFRRSGFKYLLLQDGKITEVDAKKNLPQYIPVGDRCTLQNGIVTVTRKGKFKSSGPRSSYLLADDLAIGPGHKHHPAVRLWLGFERALTQYMNAHIKAWIERDGENNLPTYPLVDCPRPAWTYNPDIYRRTKAILLQREIERNEKIWYLTKVDFLQVWLHKPEKAQVYVDLFRPGLGLHVGDYLRRDPQTVKTLLTKGHADVAIWL